MGLKNKTLEDYRKALRKRPTPYEKAFRVMLKKACQIRGTSFCFQEIFRKKISGYIVDFYVADYRIIFEIDGIDHSKEPKKSADKIRDEWFAKKRITVFRILNEHVEDNAEKLIELAFKGRRKGKSIIRDDADLLRKCRKIEENGQIITICPEITEKMVKRLDKPKQYRKKRKKKKGCRLETPGTFSGSILWKK